MKTTTTATTTFQLSTILIFYAMLQSAAAFVTHSNVKSRTPPLIISMSKHHDDPTMMHSIIISGNDATDDAANNVIQTTMKVGFTSFVLGCSLLMNTSGNVISTTANAAYYANVDNDMMAGEAADEAVSSLRQSAGDASATFAALERVAKIITEGDGVGGAVSYSTGQSGVVDRGLVSDEDTTIYNPGLSLLTNTEKNEIVRALVDNKQVALKQNKWTEDNQLGFEFLKGKLDPFHVYELKGYLSIFPFYGAAVYLFA